MTPAKMLVTSTLVYIFLQTCYLRICFTRSEDIERWNAMNLCSKAIRVYNEDIKFVYSKIKITYCTSAFLQIERRNYEWKNSNI